MERVEFLKRMRSLAESLYDHFAPCYWVTAGTSIDAMHQEYLQKFLALVGEPGVILSAACGAGRFDGPLMDAGYDVLGIDQSAGVLARARDHFPQAQFPRVRYEKLGLQEMDFHAEFDGVICLDAMEHICPEDWPGIVRGFADALKPGGPLYITADVRDASELDAVYQHALAMGLPVVYGEIADEVEAAYQHALDTGETLDQCVYHFSPPLEQIQDWMEQAGLKVVEVCTGSEYTHIIAVKES